MRYSYSLLIVLIFIAENSMGQRVKRKGSTPVEVSPNNRQAAVAQYTLQQCVGKWQEVTRTGADKQQQQFKDSIFIDIAAKGSASIKQGLRVTMKGDAAIDAPGNLLLVATDAFTILSVSIDELLLQDDDGTIHSMQKKEVFWNETLGMLINKEETYNDIVTPAFANLKGTWVVYRRQSKPGYKNDSILLIRSLTITDSTSNKIANGTIVFYSSDKTQEQHCQVHFTSNGFEIIAGKNTWNFNLYKAANKEIVFGDPATLLYFAKP